MNKKGLGGLSFAVKAALLLFLLIILVVVGLQANERWRGAEGCSEMVGGECRAACDSVTEKEAIFLYSEHCKKLDETTPKCCIVKEELKGQVEECEKASGYCKATCAKDEQAYPQIECPSKSVCCIDKGNLPDETEEDDFEFGDVPIKFTVYLPDEDLFASGSTRDLKHGSSYEFKISTTGDITDKCVYTFWYPQNNVPDGLSTRLIKRNFFNCQEEQIFTFTFDVDEYLNRVLELDVVAFDKETLADTWGNQLNSEKRYMNIIP